MKYCIVIPAFNEEVLIEKTLQSLVNQTLSPNAVIIVDDNSTDGTFEVVRQFITPYDNYQLVSNISSAKHLPGSKVINAFYCGFKHLPSEYDFVVKLDADLILPYDYFEKITATFQSDPTIGMVGGEAYVQTKNGWQLENLTDRDHIRGAFKSYRKTCFEQIGGLRPAMGWDTVDELLTKFYGWRVVVLPELKVKHLKPTGAVYDKSARYKQGVAFYRLGYGFCVTFLASIKLALKKGRPFLFVDYIRGFFKAKAQNLDLLVTPAQAKFIRKYRWQRIKAKLFG